MSFAIDLDYVIAVLLEDGWHNVADDTFVIDAVDFVYKELAVVTGGQVEGFSATGATWKEPDDSWVACPFPSIRAIRYKFLKSAK